MRTTRYSILAAAFATLCLTAALAQAPQDGMLSGVVVTSGTGQLEIETSDGRKTFQVAPAVVMPADLQPGDLVLVSVSEPGSLDANRILIVNDTIVVTEDRGAEQAVVGTVKSTSPQQLIVETTTGGQAFVIDPEKLFPPLPAPDQRVAVMYRTLEVHPPQYMATGLVLLSDDVRISSLETETTELSATDEIATETSRTDPTQISEIAPPPPPLTETEELAEVDDDASWRETPPTVSTQVAEAEEPEPFDTESDELDTTADSYDSAADETLPRTAGSLPALLGIGLLAIVLGAALRFAR
jgi:hypothetical protein